MKAGDKNSGCTNMHCCGTETPFVPICLKLTTKNLVLHIQL